MERQITAFLHARSATLVALMAACVAAYVAWARGLVLPAVTDMGLGLPSPSRWLGDSLMSLLLSLGVNVAVGMVLIWINRTFNTMRSLTAMGATLFYVMECAMPGLTAHFYGGTLLALVALVCIVLLFSVYGLHDKQRRIYLIFFLLALGSFFQVAFLLFVPVFLLGCVQMRVFSLRTFLAALLGLITPPWILFGFGIVRPDMVHWPRMVMVWNLFDTDEMVKALVETGFTLLCGVSFMVANLLKILSYNSRVRAYNGFINVLWIATAVYTMVNFNDFTFYIPLLYIFTAYQAAHFFTYHRNRRSYLPVLLLIAVYAAFSLWSFI